MIIRHSGFLSVEQVTETGKSWYIFWVLITRCSLKIELCDK